jgi:exopolyphosphatase/guanosine-5'-triphosphate,3'-diphosphate pyrophosphatase
MNIPAAREEILALMHALEEEPHHVRHVASLAVHLFDELEDLHGLGDHDRFLLEAASYLHDIGWSVAKDGRGHHRESARLIREHGWKHCSLESTGLIAQVARYHRKSPPTLEHEEFAALAPAERRRVQKLAAFLRIADGLDRSHQQYISHLSAEIFPGRIVVHLIATHPASREVAAAMRKCDLAQNVFQREIIFAPQPGAQWMEPTAC